LSKALAAVLAAEHAAIFAYGRIGVRLKGAAVRAARAAESAHRAHRDDLVVLLAAGAASPPPAEPAYALPFPVTDAASALRLAIHVEERAAAAWRAALPATAGEQRRQVLDGLTACAVRAMRWRQQADVNPATVAFPGRTV